MKIIMDKKHVIKFTPCIDINEIVEYTVNELLIDIKSKNILNVGLSGNETLIPILESLAYNIKKQKINISHVNFFTLFEFVKNGQTPYFNLINNCFYKKLNIDYANVYFLNEDNEKYIEKITKDGLDIVLIETGIDGNLALLNNKPFIKKWKRINKTKLTESIRNEYANLFLNKQDVPVTAMCAPIKIISNAKKVVLVSSGIEKSSSTAMLMTNKYQREFLITLLCKNKNVYLFADLKACELVISE